MSHVDAIRLRTTKRDGLDVRQQIGYDMSQLSATGRLSVKYTPALCEKFGFEKPSTGATYLFVVKDPREQVNPELAKALQLATVKDNKQRDTEALVTFWKQATKINQRDLLRNSAFMI